MPGGALDATARARALDAIRARLGSTQVSATAPVLGALVDGWLADLEAILGGIRDREVDPRFVEGVLVATRQS
jgi:hypothetical protein